MSGQRQYAFLDHPGLIAFAHRGGAAEAPENTWAAFGHAIDHLGFRYVETDVHATADGVVAVIHDPVLDRVSDRHGLVGAHSWHEVARAHVGDGRGIPRLDEVLAAWPDARWNIDAKHDAVVEPLAEVVRRAGALARVCITSFSDARLGRIRRLLGPELCTAMGPRGIATLRAASLVPVSLPPSVWRGAAAAQVPLRQGRIPLTDARFVAAAHRYRLGVHVWTIDDPVAMDHLVDLGVDGIMTDRPTVLADVLRRRGRWA